MPLFDWLGALSMMTGPGSPFTILLGELERFEEDVESEHLDVRVSKDQLELARLLAQRGERERSAEAKLARTRWLEEHDAERTFPCGVVPDPVLEATQPEQPAARRRRALLPSDPGWAAPEPSVTETTVPPDPRALTPLRPMQVIAAVLPDDVVFIREFGDDEEVDEVGRLPRNAIQDVGVVDTSGAHIPEPIEETVEPPRLVWGRAPLDRSGQAGRGPVRFPFVVDGMEGGPAPARSEAGIAPPISCQRGQGAVEARRHVRMAQAGGDHGRHRRPHEGR